MKTMLTKATAGAQAAEEAEKVLLEQPTAPEATVTLAL